MFLRRLATAALLALAACAGTVEDEADTSGAAVRATTASRYPILLVHGYNASPAARGYGTIAPVLEAHGFEVAMAVLPPFAGSDERATVLARNIDKLLAATGARKVNVIAHSLGGLDARIAVSRLGYADRVASISTISTPHRGTKTARVFAGMAEWTSVQLLADWIGCDASNRDVCKTFDLPAALASLSEASSRTFNDATPDARGVFYQSWATTSAMNDHPTAAETEAVSVACEKKISGDRPAVLPLPLWTLQKIVKDDGPNDGLVEVESAKWGLFRGCLRSNHMEIVGTDTPNEVGFDSQAFYTYVARDLATRGF